MRGTAHHERAVRALIDSYQAIPDNADVRLAKTTSNLFRPRAAVTGPGLDVSGLDGVISIDPKSGTADVQGMCTYETLVAETLKFGFIPTVVPQLRTITLGGAVTGLGIEATSLRNGLPHEAVQEMDILTGDGEIVTARPEGEHAALFAAFPNSYGSLGYAVRLRIRLERVPQFVRLRHVRMADAAGAVATIAQIGATGDHDGIRVDAVDGTAFSPDEIYLTLAEFTDASGSTSDYTGQQVYYRSIQERSTDRLTMLDYLWRWDTDWFWCSAAFGAQNRFVRRIWPRSLRRSDSYHRLLALDTRYGLSRLLDRWKGVPRREKVIQDIEVPLEQLPEFLDWFDERIGMRPVWLCPLRTQTVWPTYPLRPGQIYVNVGFWGTVATVADVPPGAVNREIEEAVSALGGHKSLYSEAFYDRQTFSELYGTAGLELLRKQYDPQERLRSLYEKAVKNT